jgi:hypothetical protein
VSMTECHPTAGWNASLAFDLLKGLKGGTVNLTGGKTPGYSCTTTGKG